MRTHSHTGGVHIARRDMLAVSGAALGAAVAAPAWPQGTPGASGPISESFVIPEWSAAFADAVSARGDRGDHAMLAALARTPPVPAASGLLTLPAPGIELFEPALALALARLVNDRLASTVQASGGRLGGFATIVAGDPDGVREARRARNNGLEGIALAVNRGWRLDHPDLRAVLTYAAANDVVVYLPARHAPFAGSVPYEARGDAGVIAGASADSANHALQLMFGGVLDDHPGLQVVLARLGEAAPYWLAQFAAIHAGCSAPPRHTPGAYFARSIRLTTADMHADTQLHCQTTLGAGRMLASA